MGNHGSAGIRACAAIFMSAQTGTAGQPCEPHWSERFPDGELGGPVSALTVFDDGSGGGPALYAGGNFDWAGDQAVHRIARFDGGGWSPLGEGFLRGAVVALVAFDDGAGPALFAGGSFVESGDVIVNRVARWDGKSWSPLGMGLDGNVHTLAAFDDGSGSGLALFAGGVFDHSGPVEVRGIARWSGSSWEPVADGVDGIVLDLAVFDDRNGAGPALYAAGYFTHAGGAAVSNIARWDGKSWSDVGGGIAGFVDDLEVFDDGTGSALYAGGAFDAAGGAEANNIARWDGANWSALGTGIDDHVTCLHAFDDGTGSALYVGGAFDAAGGAEAANIARWDGANWSALGAGIDLLVFTLAGFDDGSGAKAALFAGGLFYTAGDVEANYIAKWDGSDWSAPGHGTNDAVHAVTVFDDESGSGPALLIAGEFTRAGGIRANRIARWDGEHWTPVGGGIDLGTVYALAGFDDGSSDGPALYAGGLFDGAGGTPVQSIARWDGETWSDVGGGVDGYVSELVVFDEASGPALYVGGNFLTAGDLPAPHVARWDGARWSALSDGPGGRVNALRNFDDRSGKGPQLYAGGVFSSPRQPHAVARWDGTTWHDVGETLLLGGAWDLVIYDDGSGAGPALYAGGTFEHDDFYFTVARWDGAAWTPVPGSPSVAYVYSMVVIDDGLDDHPALYVGGTLTHEGAPLIARWNGKTWSALGGGLEGPDVDYPWSMVTSLAVFPAADRGLSLVAGGRFTRSGGLSAENLAEWALCVEPPLGDVDGDTIVDLEDLLLLLDAWGPCPAPCSPACPADLDGNCAVDVRDFLLLLQNWT